MPRKIRMDIRCDSDRNDRQSIVAVNVKFDEIDTKANKIIKTEVFSGAGASIKNMHDKEIPMVGLKIAFAESLEQLARRLKRSAWDTIYERGSRQESYEEVLDKCLDYFFELENRAEKMLKREEMREKYSTTPEAVAKHEERQAKKAVACK